MEVQQAKDYYTGKTGVRYNCAQAVAVAFNGSPAKYVVCGGGRAPEGWCGAAYAAAEITADRPGVEKLFLEQAGTVKCAELRNGRRLSCIGCIEKSAQFVKEKALVAG